MVILDRMLPDQIKFKFLKFMQCTSCWEENVVFDSFKEVPHLVIAIFIEKPIPFLEEFFYRVAELDYPKDKTDLFIHTSEEFHVSDVEDFLRKFNVLERTMSEYSSLRGSIAVQLISCLFSLDSAALLIYVELASALSTCLVESKPVKQEVSRTVSVQL